MCMSRTIANLCLFSYPVKEEGAIPLEGAEASRRLKYTSREINSIVKQTLE